MLLSALFFLSAGSALAATLQPGYGMMGTATISNGNAVYQTQSASGQKIQGYMYKLQQGQLTAEEQKDMYGFMAAPAGVSGSFAFPPMMGYAAASSAGQGQFFYRSGSMMSGWGNKGAWYALMHILTVVLVWTALLLCIAALFKYIKHKQH